MVGYTKIIKSRNKKCPHCGRFNTLYVKRKLDEGEAYGIRKEYCINNKCHYSTESLFRAPPKKPYKNSYKRKTPYYKMR